MLNADFLLAKVKFIGKSFSKSNYYIQPRDTKFREQRSESIQQTSDTRKPTAGSSKIILGVPFG